MALDNHTQENTNNGQNTAAQSPAMALQENANEDMSSLEDQDMSFGDDDMSMDDAFSDLLDESLRAVDVNSYSVVMGRVVAIDKDRALIDVGAKAEGWIPLSEFEQAPLTANDSVASASDASGADQESGSTPKIAVGDEVEVFIERVQSKDGNVVMSRAKALREKIWVKLEEKFKNGERVEGVIQGRVRGGFNVMVEGLNAFLPGSQVDVRPVRDVTPLMDAPQPFRILKMDRMRGNVLVSRRAVVEEKRSEKREQLFKSLKEGQIVEGIVKNLTDYGAFVDLGGADGLIHIADISWNRVNTPAEVLHVDQKVRVKVLRIGADGSRIGLGLKQLESDPWESIEERYPIGHKVTGTVRNIADYGVFVRLESGIEGLVHVSQMAWSRRKILPSKMVTVGQEVEVMVLTVDQARKRIGLGMRQCHSNPWEEMLEQYPKGTELEGEIRNTTEFGLFVGVTSDIDGMVHISDISWDVDGEKALEPYKKGDMVKVKVLAVDPARERVSLGIKQLTERPQNALDKYQRGKVVTSVVTRTTDAGIFVSVGDEGVEGFIRRNDIALSHEEAHPDRFARGEKVDAKVIRIDRDTNTLQLSIRARETDEERQTIEAYGSVSAGASLGDILGVALEKATGEHSASKSASDSSSTSDDSPLDAAKDQSKSADADADADAAEKVASPRDKVTGDDKAVEDQSNDQKKAEGSSTITEDQVDTASESTDHSKSEQDSASSTESSVDEDSAHKE